MIVFGIVLFILALIWAFTRKRTLKELYELVLQEHIKHPRAICGIIAYLEDHKNINRKEADKLFTDFRIRKPSKNKYKEFYENPSYTGEWYWWPKTSAGMKQRKLFLEHIIKSLK